MGQKALKIGTRGSKLALIQAHMVEAKLKSAHSDLETQIVEIKTSGDWKPQDGETRLSEADGGKGLFAKEIETALLNGDVDIGVHSLKDMPSFLPDGLVIEHVLERADPRDAFISLNYKSLSDLPEGAVLGTSSLRRQAIALFRCPDLKIVPLRGNVETRLRKIEEGQADATLLAAAGLHRMGLQDKITAYLPPEMMLPAAAQGIVGIERRAADEDIKNLLDPIHHEETGLCAIAERRVLQILDGSCHTPIGAYAQLENQLMWLRAFVASEDGVSIFYEDRDADVRKSEDALALGEEVGQALKQSVPPELLT